MPREVFINDVRRAVRMAEEAQQNRNEGWLTPRVVADFNVDDFQDVAPDLRESLSTAVKEFKSTAERAQAQTNWPATEDQFHDGVRSLKLLESAVHDIIAPEWTFAVEKVVDEVEQWAKDREWHVRRDSKMVTDTLLGTYSLPRLTIRTEDHQFILEPITRFAPGSSGVVDILSVPSLYSVPITRDEQNQWRLRTPDNLSRRQPFDSRTFVSTLTSLGQKEE